MKVSEVGFGAWAIGGKSYGAVDRRESLRALEKAEELGCNFMDTAEVYGGSEGVLGEFLHGNKRNWLVSTKYSGQKEGLLHTAEQQLKKLRIDTIDFYQIHWAPRNKQKHLYEDLYQLKRSGKVRYVGVSLHSEVDIDYVLDHADIDGFQVPFSLIDPYPYLARIKKIRDKKVGIIIRSCLKSGFFTGKYSQDTIFTDPNDQRYKWSREQISQTIKLVDRFRFLEKDAGSMLVAAAGYPLSFPETSTLLLGTKTVEQAEVNFGKVPSSVLSDQNIEAITVMQKKLGLRARPRHLVKSLLNLLKRQRNKFIARYS
jgi:aryl-alcohol dehydrogenase-like predicted oxidoreductase